ncbi:MAG TPA: potassium channel family protein [Vicinamibacterales bacterium]|nr:potassium channel family protein [Vicinamibacterales bacterium]
MSEKLEPNTLRRKFLIQLLEVLKVVWPILAGLLGVMVALGCAIAVIEDWSLFEGVYFAFVSGLTIGYGDLAPKAPLARVLAVTIGFTGIVLTGLVAAVAVQALYATQQSQDRR